MHSKTEHIIKNKHDLNREKLSLAGIYLLVCKSIQRDLKPTCFCIQLILDIRLPYEDIFVCS